MSKGNVNSKEEKKKITKKRVKKKKKNQLREVRNGLKKIDNQKKKKN